MIDFTRPTAHPKLKILRKLSVIFLGLYIILLAYLSLVPTVPSAQEVSDKLLHFLAYGTLTALTAAAFPNLKMIYLFLSAAIMGAVLEGGQGLLDMGRTASVGDQLANMGGAALALLIWASIVAFWSLVKR